MINNPPSNHQPSDPTARRVLLVEDDESLREVLSINLEDLGFSVTQASTGREGLTLFQRSVDRGTPYPVVLTDLKMPELTGFELLGTLKALDSEVCVIVLTAFGGVERALEAMRRGAFHYVEKPVNMSALSAELHRALQHRLGAPSMAKQPSRGARSLIATSPMMNEVLKVVDRVAHSDAPVMVLGESGVGKELIARALHERSRRADGPWVTVNCAAIPTELLESVLFGYERGAFTGADRRADGKFSAASGGTLFLDEIAEMSPALQAKLLRVLQDGLVERVGSIKPEPVDVRIVTATHQDLEEAMRRGTFRRDLYYRLHVIPLRIPPLRERSADIPVLIRHFIRELSPQRPLEVASEVDQACLRYQWPGNVRELRNLIERMILLREGDLLTARDLPESLRDLSILDEEAPLGEVRLEGVSFHLPPNQLDLKALERAVIIAALSKHEGNRSATARYLKIPRHALLYRLDKLTERSDNESSSELSRES